MLYPETDNAVSKNVRGGLCSRTRDPDFGRMDFDPTHRLFGAQGLEAKEFDSANIRDTDIRFKGFTRIFLQVQVFLTIRGVTHTGTASLA